MPPTPYLTTAPLTSIVILSYNRKDDLQNNLRSLYTHTNLPFEVIIFDNASDRETINYLKSIEDLIRPDGNGPINVFYNDQNIGCSQGRREAIKHAEGDYIYTVDNDMTYTPNWLNALITRIEQHPTIGAASSKIFYPNNRIQLNGGHLYLEEDYFGSFVEIDQGKWYLDSTLTGEMDCDWLCGGATLFKREATEKVAHDPQYLNGFEDYDYSFQIQDLGYRLVNCPSSVVYHHHIGFDKQKQQQEISYMRDRGDNKHIWLSMLHFLEKTGINMIKTTEYYDWLEDNGTKPFLQWGEINRRTFSYPDLFPGYALSELTNQELKTQFDAIIAKNKAMR